MKISDDKVVNELWSNAQKMVDNGFPIDAVPYYEEAARLLENQKNTVYLGKCYEQIGYCYELDTRWSEASQWYSKARDMYIKAGNDAQAKQAEGAANYAKSQSS